MMKLALFISSHYLSHPPITKGLPGKHETTKEFVKKNNEVIKNK